MKKLCSIFLIFAMLFIASSSVWALPSNMIVIGGKAFSIDLLFNEDYFDVINEALTEAEGKLYYNLGNEGNEYKSLFGSAPITEKEKEDLGSIKVFLNTGKVEVYDDFEDETPEEIPMVKSHDSVSDQSIMINGSIELPKTVEVVLDDADETTKVADISWDLSDFDSSKAGKYTIVGKLYPQTIDADSYTVPVGMKLSVNVVVSEKPQGIADIEVEVGNIASFKKITLHSLTEGQKIKIDGYAAIEVGTVSNIMVSGKEIELSVLDMNDDVIASIMLDVSKDSRLEYSYEINSKTMRYSVETASTISFKKISVLESGIGSKFRVAGSTTVADFGGEITLMPDGDMLMIYLLDSDEVVLKSIEVDISQSGEFEVDIV